MKRHLVRGERVEWVGRPVRNFFALEPIDEIGILPAFLFLAVSLTLEIEGLHAGPKDSWVVSVIGFCTVTAFAAYTAFGRVLYRAYRKRHAVYVVTNGRVLVIVRGVRRDSVKARNLDALERVSPNTDDFGKGTLYFEIPLELERPEGLKWRYPGDSDSRNFWSGWPRSFAFYDIDYPSTVATLVKRLREEGGVSGP